MRCQICGNEEIRYKKTNETKYYDLVDNSGILEYTCRKCGATWKTTSGKKELNKGNKFLGMMS